MRASIANDCLNGLMWCRMMEALLSAAKAIYETHQRERVSAAGDGEASTLAGEEILPILCYVIAHTDVICLGVLAELMSTICDPNVLNGESGYYLTVLGAALSFLRSITPEQVTEWECTRCEPPAGSAASSASSAPPGGGGVWTQPAAYGFSTEVSPAAAVEGVVRTSAASNGPTGRIGRWFARR